MRDGGGWGAGMLLGGARSRQFKGGVMAEVGAAARAVRGPGKRLLGRSSKLQETQLLLQTQRWAGCPDKALSPIF